MHDVFQLTQDPGWVLQHEGYSVLSESARVRILLDGQPQLLSDGKMLAGVRKLDLRRGLLLSELSHRSSAGITITGRELRLVSMADRGVGLQLLLFSLDRDGVDVELEANFAMAGLGMQPLRLERDFGAWRAEGTGKGVAMAGSATLMAGDEPLVPDRPFSLRWVWRWRSIAGQVVEFDRIVSVARADTPGDVVALDDDIASEPPVFPRRLVGGEGSGPGRPPSAGAQPDPGLARCPRCSRRCASPSTI
jgi:hypothetical protein